MIVAGCVVTCAAEEVNVLSDEERAEGWRLLWDGRSLDGWVRADGRTPAGEGWQISDGVLSVVPRRIWAGDGKWEWTPIPGGRTKGGLDICTTETFRDFHLKVDFRLTKGANSGIKYFFNPGRNGGTSLEYQLLDPAHPVPPGTTEEAFANRRIASLYYFFPADAAGHLKPCGEWNTAEIVSSGRHVEHRLNGAKVLDYERGGAAFRAAFAKTKWNVPKFTRDGAWGEAPEGRILLQDHDDAVSFRNIKIRPLEKEPSPLAGATVRIRYANGKEETRRVGLERRPDGAWRARFRTIDMSPDMRCLDIVPDAAVTPKCDGYWVDGDCRWGRFDRDEQTPMPDTKRIRQTRTEGRLPIFGIKTPSICFVGVVKGLRLECQQYVTVSKGVYTFFVRFNLDRIEFSPYEDAVVDLYPLEGADANYSGMARTYRRIQLTEGGCTPLRERIKGNPALAFAADSIFLRCKFGRCDRRLSTREEWLRGPMPPVVVDHTFDDFMDIMRTCKAAGMDRIEMCMVGFQPNGHDGPFPDLFPADERFGGEAKMREAIALGKSLGYRMTIHLNQHNFYKNAKRFHAPDVGKGPDGELRKYTVYPGGQVYHSCYEVICNKYFDKDLADMKDLGLNGLVHVDVMSARLPTPCHDPMHPADRREGAAWIRQLGLKAREAFGGYSSECGFDHFASALDNVLYQCAYPGWATPKTDLVDGYLPLWSIVYNGIIMSNPFYATIDASCPREANGISDATGDGNPVYHYLDTPERRMLKVFEFGGRPMFYYANYRTEIPCIKKMYDLYQPIRHLQLEFLEDHAEIAPDVFRSRYSNGEEVVCNYTDKPFAYRGRDVAPLAYRLYGKEL